MKTQSLLIASSLLLGACDVKVNNPPNPPVKEEKTTIVNPSAEKKTEKSTTVSPDGTTTEKKTETTR